MDSPFNFKLQDQGGVRINYHTSFGESQTNRCALTHSWTSTASVQLQVGASKQAMLLRVGWMLATRVGSSLGELDVGRWNFNLALTSCLVQVTLGAWVFVGTTSGQLNITNPHGGGSIHAKTANYGLVVEYIYG